MRKIYSSLQKSKKSNKKNNSFFKFFILLIGIPNLILILLVSVMLMYVGSVMVEDPKIVGEEDVFSMVLSDSIEMYGNDFCDVLAAYLAEYKSFDKYNRIDMGKYRDKEVLNRLLDDKGVKELSNEFYMMYGKIVEEEEGIFFHNWYFPIADGYEPEYLNDYGNSRTYGGDREHKGNDLMIEEGAPIIAVESGTIEKIGWNNLGGWRIGIRSNDGVRYWFYGHMRKLHPYVRGLVKGSEISGGQVIGYVGSTGYSKSIEPDSMPDNNFAVDKKFDPHLHIGVNVKVNGRTVYYNPFPILNFLKRNKMKVAISGEEFKELGKSIQERYIYTSSIFAVGGLGYLSQKYESNGDPATIANNAGDIGGKSYGAFQFASNLGSVYSFLMWVKNADEEIYNRLIKARRLDGGYGDNFDYEWKAIADEDGENFYNLQYSYIKISYFDPVISYFQRNSIIDFSVKSDALKNVIWSTSVQHGVGGAIRIINIILKQEGIEAEEAKIIDGIYDERQKVWKYFASSSNSIKSSVWNRFENERKDALAMLINETNNIDITDIALESGDN